MTLPRITNRRAAMAATAIGLIAVGLGFHYVPRLAETGKVNVIGPLAGSATVPTGSGEDVTTRFSLVADIRRPAVFVRYAERAFAQVTLDDGEALPEDVDPAALNDAVADFVRAESATHPGLASIAVPAFDAGDADGATAVRTRYSWSAVALNAAGLAALGLVGAGLAFAAISAGRRVLLRVPASRAG